jgi:RNA polymerase sigma factor for flagellar operon FliA
VAVQTEKNPVVSTQNVAEANVGTEHLKYVALRSYVGQKISVSGTPKLDEETVAQYLPMVHKIARRVATYIRPPLSFEDLISAGFVGLVKACRDYDSSHKAEFKTYAYIKIKGAILDEMRSLSLLPVNLNRRIRDAFRLYRKIQEQRGTAPTDEELAEKLGITVDEVYELFESARAQHFISLDGLTEDQSASGDFLLADNTDTPDKQIEQAELIDKLTQAIQQLTQRQRQIILLYYQQHLTMKQIAEVLKITESRISQLHASAIFNLSAKLRQWKDDG